MGEIKKRSMRLKSATLLTRPRLQRRVDRFQDQQEQRERETPTSVTSNPVERYPHGVFRKMPALVWQIVGFNINRFEEHCFRRRPVQHASASHQRVPSTTQVNHIACRRRRWGIIYRVGEWEEGMAHEDGEGRIGRTFWMRSSDSSRGCLR